MPKFQITFQIGSVYNLIVEAVDEDQILDFKYEISDQISRDALRTGLIGHLKSTFVGEVVDSQPAGDDSKAELDITELEGPWDLPDVILPVVPEPSSWVTHGPGFEEVENIGAEYAIEDQTGHLLFIGDAVRVYPWHYETIDCSGDAIGLLRGAVGEVMEFRSYNFEDVEGGFAVLVKIEDLGLCVIRPNDLEKV